MALVNIIRDYDKSQSEAAAAGTDPPPPQWDSDAVFRDDQQMAYDGPVSAAAQEEDFPQLQLQPQPQPPVAPPSHDELVSSESSCSFLDGYSNLFGEHTLKYLYVVSQNMMQLTRADDIHPKLTFSFCKKGLNIEYI